MPSLYLYLFEFATFFILAKLVDNGKLKFYAAGLLFACVEPIYTIGFRVIAELGTLGHTDLNLQAFVSLLPHVLLVAVVATIFFWLLDHYEDTIAAWLGIFVSAMVVLIFVV